MTAKKAKRNEAMAPVVVEVVRNLDQLMATIALRAVVYMGEQHCPFTEEFDGNDFVGATHLLAREAGEPVGVLRIRWFAAFAKVERVAVSTRVRGRGVVLALMNEAVQIAAHKGYRIMLGHVQARLLRYWKRAFGAQELAGRPRFVFSDHEYVEVAMALTPPADAIDFDTPALVVLRPEGAWRQPGVLEASAHRPATNPGAETVAQRRANRGKSGGGGPGV